MVEDGEERKIRKSFISKRLTNSQLEAVRHFEDELNIYSQHQYYCTTKDTYDLKIDSKEAHFKVDYCNWKGIYGLVKSIFGESIR